MNCSRRSLLKKLALLASASSFDARAAGDLVFGHVGSHSGVQSATGIDLRNGISMYFDFVNANGGVKGRRLVLESIDDEYKPEKTVRAARELEAGRKVIALLATLGTENNDALIKSGILAQAGMINFGPRAAAGVLEASKETYRVRASYAAEMRKIVGHSTTVGVTRFGLVMQGDGLGREGEKALLAVLAANPDQLVARASYDRTTSDVSKAVDAMRKSQAQALIFVGISKACAAFVSQYREQGGGAVIYAISVVDPTVVAKEAGAHRARGLIVSQTMPSPLKVSMPLMRELIQAHAAARAKVNLNYTTVEGYAVAKAAVEILRESSRLDREGFRKTLAGASREMDLGGLILDFSGGKRDGGKYVELSVIGRDGKVRN